MADVLFVEDSQVDAELISKELLAYNNRLTILHLQDGEEALEYIFGTGRFEGRNVRDTPRLILLDLKMPKIGGQEVLKKVRSNIHTQMIPVVVLTSSKEKKDIIESQFNGANSYIVKPLAYEAFKRAISCIAHYWLSVNQSPD